MRSFAQVVSAHAPRMAHVARLVRTPANVKADPIQVGFFYVEAIVHVQHLLAHLIEQTSESRCVPETLYRPATGVSTGLHGLHRFI